MGCAHCTVVLVAPVQLCYSACMATTKTPEHQIEKDHFTELLKLANPDDEGAVNAEQHGHVMDQLLRANWSELKVIESAGSLLFPDKIYRRRADGSFEGTADLNCPVQGDYSRPGDNKPYAKQSGTDHKWGEQGSKNRRSVWTVPPSPYAGSHHAVMPSKLIEPCIKAGCPVDGVVLDPFMGSGTVGKVAQSLGRLWLGFDLDERNAALVNKRIATGK